MMKNDLDKREICFCIGCIDNCGGTERVTNILTDELIKNTSWNISILSYEKSEGERFFDFASKVKIDYLFDSKIDFKRYYGEIIRRLNNYFNEKRYDVIVAVDVSQMIFLSKAVDKNISKIVAWEQFNYFQSRSGIVGYIARKLTCKYADIVVTLTDSDAHEYKKHIKGCKKVERIYNYLSQSHMEIPYKQTENDIIKLLSVGRLTKQKGFDILVDIAYLLKKHKIKFVWTIVGEGDERKKIEKKIKKRKLEDYVNLVGKQKDVQKFYNSSDIFIFTSRYEGFGLVIIEAQAYGLPVVSFDCMMGPNELIVENENGYLVSCFDKNQMMKKIAKLINDKSLRNRFSEKSKMLFENYNRDLITEQWIRLIEGI